MPTIILHLLNEDPVMGEVDTLPAATDLLITVNNPRRRDGKDLTYLEQTVTTVVWPLARINFIEVIPGESEEKIISHVRE
jgi:hypothetical protein